MIACARWPHHVAAVSTLASKIVELSDVRVLIMVVEMDGRVFVVGRSRTAALDVGVVLESLGGGGHAPAASAVIRDRDLDQVRAAVIDALPKGVTAGARARDIMSAPAWFVDEGLTVEEALAECRRRQTSGVHVEVGGRAGGGGRTRRSRPCRGPSARTCTGAGGHDLQRGHDLTRRHPDRDPACDREGPRWSGRGRLGRGRRPPGRGRCAGRGHAHRPVGSAQPAAARNRG